MVDDEIDFRVLGSVEAVRGAERIRLGGRRPRALLALLLLEAGRRVAADWLIDEVWRDETPSGTSTLPSYVSRLRAALGSPGVIEARASGYTLNASDDQIDARRFERLIDEGRDWLAQGRANRAADRFRAALALWRGRPFGDLADDGALRIEAERLEELRLLAVESRIDADLALGASVDLVDELEVLVRQHPYRERFWAQLMLALYRARRQADALAVYGRARQALDRDLGLEPSDMLQQLQLAILRQDVPIVKALETRHNLPASLTSFIGRDAELAEIGRLLDEARLVTLTGVGGVGKTRLALEASARLLPDVPDGVFFADLSAVSDPSLVARGISLALGLGEHTETQAADVLTEALRGGRKLLVLDNCEHVRERVAELAERLLRASPGTQILATSREALGAPGEVDYPIPPMSLPALGADADQTRASDAVQLFLARAREVRPRLQDDAETVANAARVAVDLDGLPLAIELAAARAKALSLAEIASRLSDRFRFLVSWRRLSAARHRTLREAMDWSVGLLSAEEQQLFARLSVFVGDFTLDGAARVCTEGDEERALTGLERLVAASLVMAEERDSEMRYRLLETVRQYAAEQLDRESTEEVRRAHARYFLGVAEQADLTAVRRGAGQRLDVAIAAQDNLRRALAWAIESGSVSFGLELATSLERFWVTHDPSEGMRWFAALFDHPGIDDVAPAVRANALRAYGGAADIAGDDIAAGRLWERSLAIFRALGDEAGQAVLLHRLAISAQRRGDLARARELVGESHRIHERLDDGWGQAQTLGTLGAISRDTGDRTRAIELLQASLDLARKARVTWWVSGTLAELANLELNAGRVDEADRQARESLALADQMGDRAGRVFGVGLVARVAAERGQRDLARSLWAAVADEDAGAPLGGWRRHRETYRDRLHDLLPPADDPTEDARPTLEDAVSLALSRPTLARTARGAAKA